MSIGGDRIGGNTNSIVERALEYGKSKIHENRLWEQTQTMLVGVESTDQIFIPSQYEGLDKWKRLGTTLCTIQDNAGRPLGGDWAMSVFRVTDPAVYAKISGERLVLTTFGNVTYLGCWQDGEPRVMSVGGDRLNGVPRDEIVERALPVHPFKKYMDALVSVYAKNKPASKDL